VSRLLVVVARTDSERYESFKSVFAEDATVEVIFNRREGERRQRDAPVQMERRHDGRRVLDITYELRRLGYALVRRSAPAREMVASPKRILVVDDKQIVLDALSEYLATIGYTVKTAANGAEALAAVAAGSGPARHSHAGHGWRRRAQTTSRHDRRAPGDYVDGERRSCRGEENAEHRGLRLRHQAV